MADRNTIWTELANAIVCRACNDYRAALRNINNYTYGVDTEWLEEVDYEERRRECIRFFLSDYFKSLTNLSGPYLLDRLNKEYEDELKTKIAR